MTYALASRLERAVRASGLQYREVNGWKSRGHATMGTIQSVMCHHTAGPASGNTPSLNVVAHGRPGLSGPLAQLYLARDGTVYLVAAGLAYHAGKVSSSAYQNSHSIGIEAEATGVSAWPVSQVSAYAQLCRALVSEFGLATSRVVGHKEAATPRGRKIDPNFNMPDFRKKVDGATTTTTQPAPATPKGVLGMTKRINAYRKKAQKATGTRHLMINDKGDYTIATGPAEAVISAKTDIGGLKAGQHGFLILAEVMYKKGQPTVISREIATVKVTSNTVWSVAGAWALPKDHKGKSPRLRLIFKTSSKTATAHNVYISGVRD